MKPAEFQARVQTNARPIVVDVWAPWCGPCRTLSPRLDQVGEEYATQVDVWKINADAEPELVRSLGVRGIPTLILYRQGEEVARRTGLQSVEALHQLFDALVLDVAPAPQAGLSDATRWLRLLSGAALWAVAAFSGWPPVLLIVGAVIIFSGIYDRCPLWQAFTARLRGSPPAAAQ
ncbi:thioredoxin [Caldilinea sp.]|uniref:thioredoxin n=1 Tax=Caldilinea sp. TaxID=2293560 RepID=UPI002C723424|nr:thioredoxin [Anaerolineales bacterium]HQY90578.1 thioredoxin [Caldilinea sp.]HRA68657.1 thioredoxin [Caldilinea sp.]